MKLLPITRIAGLLLLAATEITALILLWLLLSPVRAPDIVHNNFFTSITSLHYCLAAAPLLLIAASILLSSRRLRQLALLSLCLAALLSVAWLRSYHTEHNFSVYFLKVFPDHLSTHSLDIQLGDGGISFWNSQVEDWDENDFPTNLSGPSPYFAFYKTAAGPGQSCYPGSFQASTSNIWNGGLLEKLAIYFISEDRLRDPDFPTTTFEGHHRALVLPFWLVLLPTLIFPALYSLQLLLNHRRRHRRARLGRCPTCNYDLRATPNQCPECGTPIPPRPTPTTAPSIPPV